MEKKMTPKIGLCREHWKYRSKKKPLPQIALHRYWNSNFSLILFSRYSPFGVVFLIIHEVVKIDDVQEMFSNVAYYCLTILLGLFVHGFIVLPLIFFLIVRTNPYRFISGMSTTLITAVATASR
jgi:Na+/serine symporter